MSHRGITGDAVKISVNEAAARRIEAASRRWFDYVRGLTTRYCAWGDVTGPPDGSYRDVTLYAAPGRGGELAKLLHAYKVARCPSDPLDP